MKYSTLLLLGVFCAISANAQTVVIINPTADNEIPTVLPYNSMVRFEFKNVNPFRLTGSASITKTNLGLDTSAGIASLLESLPLQKLSTQELTRAYALIRNDKKQLKAENQKKKKDSNTIRQLTQNIIILQQQILQIEKDINDQQQKFVRNYNNFMASYHKVAIYTASYDYLDSCTKELFVPDPKTLKANLTAYMESISDLPEVKSIRGNGKKELDNMNEYYLHAKAAYERLTDLNDRIDQFGEKAEEEEEDYYEKTIILKLDEKPASSGIPFKNEFEYMTNRLEHVNARRTAIIQRINDAVNLYNMIQNSCFAVTSDAIQLNEDEVTLIPELKTTKGEVVKKYEKIVIRTDGGTKVDVSSGYLLSFRGDDNYSSLYIDDSLYGAQKNNHDNLKHAVGILFHVYKRSAKGISFGATAGFSVPTDGTAIGFYLGGSALMLERNRLVLTAGMAFNRIKRLNTGNLIYDTGETGKTNKDSYRFTTREYREITYDNVYRPAFFVGISYNIFSIKK